MKLRFVEDLPQDFRLAFRGMRASPAFSWITVLLLALGIGANTSIFSFVNAILLKQLPVRDPARLVQMHDSENGQQQNDAYSYSFVEELSRRNQVFDGVFGRFTVCVNLTIHGASAEPLRG